MPDLAAFERGSYVLCTLAVGKITNTMCKTALVTAVDREEVGISIVFDNLTVVSVARNTLHL